MSRRLLRATLDGHTCLVEIDRNRARVKPEAGASGVMPSADANADARAGGEASGTEPPAFVVTPFDAAVTRVQEEGAPRALDVHTVIDNGIVWAFVDGEVFRVEVEDAERGTQAKRGTGDEGLSAPMPAKVIKLLVEAGQAVEAGDALLLLEAMKMELPIRAPRAARVKAFRCKAGDLVQPGVPLVDLEST